MSLLWYFNYPLCNIVRVRRKTCSHYINPLLEFAATFPPLSNLQILLIFTWYTDRQTDRQTCTFHHSLAPVRFLLFYSWHARLPPSNISSLQYSSRESHLNVEFRTVYLHSAGCLLVSKGNRVESIELCRYNSTKLKVHPSWWAPSLSSPS
jgi:hypothetical protein